jgi:hypothetical protein
MIKLTSTIVLSGILASVTIKNTSLISEPVTMLLLGAGLIGLSVFGRRIFSKKG